MCSASVSARKVDSPSTTSPIASLTTSSKRDMWAPFWSDPRSTTHSNRAEKNWSDPVWRSRMTFSTPVTPTRERLNASDGADDWTSTKRMLEERLGGIAGNKGREPDGWAALRGSGQPLGLWYQSRVALGVKRGGTAACLVSAPGGAQGL